MWEKTCKWFIVIKDSFYCQFTEFPTEERENKKYFPQKRKCMQCMEYYMYFPSGVKKGVGTYPKCNSAVWAQICSWNGVQLYISVSSISNLLPRAIVLDFLFSYSKSSCTGQLCHHSSQWGSLTCLLSDRVVPKQSLKYCITRCIKLNILL